MKIYVIHFPIYFCHQIPVEFKSTEATTSGVLKNVEAFIGKHLCWSLFLIKLQVTRLVTLLKRDSNRRFLVNITNLRTPISENIREQLLLIVVIYCIANWIKFFRNQIGILFLLKHKIYFTYSHSYSFVLSLAVILCHSLSFFCYSLSFVVTRSHSFSLAVPLVVPLVFIRCTIVIRNGEIVWKHRPSRPFFRYNLSSENY